MLDGDPITGDSHVVLSWAGGYLMASSALLIFVYAFHLFMHKHDPRNYAETSGWMFLGAACLALGVFSNFWPLWIPVAVGAFLSARRSTRSYA